METTPSQRLTVLYIEGFSPGPGLPSPLLTRCGFRVIAPRMPYDCFDLMANPYIYVCMCAAFGTFWLASLASDDDMLGEGAWWRVVLVALLGGAACLLLKRRAVAHTLDACVAVYAKEVVARNPDLVIG